MELSRIRRYRRTHRTLRRVLFNNPVLLIGLDLPFLIATSVSLRAAAALSLELLIVHMGTMAAALITRRHLDGWMRPVIHVVVSTLLMAFTRLWLVSLFRGITDTLGMYIYLMAINGLTMAQSSAVTKTQKAGQVLVGSLLNVAAFAVAMFGVSLVREYLGNGTLWGVPLPAPLILSGVQVPFFGFVIAGFLLAALRFFNKRILYVTMRERERREARFKVVSQRG